MIFRFIVKYLGFLRHIPLLPLFVDEWLKLYTFFFHRWLFTLLEEVKREVSSWPEVEVSFHRYGGLEFRRYNKEFGHIHSNGILDILFSRAMKESLMVSHHVQEHHVHTGTGWISFYVRSPEDKAIVLDLLTLSYDRTSKS